MLAKSTAVVLFGVGIGEVIQPIRKDRLCPKFDENPKGKYLLAVEVPTLRIMYEEMGCRESREHLTSGGMQWQRSERIFRDCRGIKHDKRGFCQCRRVQELLPPRFWKNVPGPKLRNRGAALFGKGQSGAWLKDLWDKYEGIHATPVTQHSNSSVPRGSSRDPQEMLTDHESEDSSRRPTRSHDFGNERSSPTHFDLRGMSLSRTQSTGVRMQPASISSGGTSGILFTNSSQGHSEASTSATSACLSNGIPEEPHSLVGNPSTEPVRDDLFHLAKVQPMNGAVARPNGSRETRTQSQDRTARLPDANEIPTDRQVWSLEDLSSWAKQQQKLSSLRQRKTPGL